MCKHQTIQLWGRIIWENICFKIYSKALYRILESKEKDIEFIEGKSWQDIMMKYFHFIAKEKRKEKKSLCGDFLHSFCFPQGNLWYCYWKCAVNLHSDPHSPLHRVHIYYTITSIYQPFTLHDFYSPHYSILKHTAVGSGRKLSFKNSSSF